MKSIRNMLTTVFSVVFIILTLFLSVCHYRFTRKVILDTMSKNRQDSLSLVSQKVDSILSGAFTLSNLLSTDDLIAGTLISDDTAPINLPAVRAQIDEIYLRYYKAFREIGLSFHIICMGNNGFSYASRQNFGSREYDMIKSHSWYGKNIGVRTETYLSTNLPDYAFGHADETDIAVVHNIFSSSGEYKGTILVCIPEKNLENAYSDLISQNHFYILNPLSVVVSSNDKNKLGSIPLDFANYRFAHSTDDYSITKSDGMTYFSSKYVSKQTDWVVFEQIPLERVLLPMHPILINAIVLVGIVCTVSIFVTYFLSQRIIQPLMELCDKMNQAAANRFQPVKMRSKLAEIHTLNEGFNHMVCEISSLMNDIHQKEQAINDAHFNFLKSQINPHFLYNTLFSIKCTVLAGHTGQAGEMITILISLLRNSISSNDSMNTLLLETNYLSQYMQLQNLRYENAILLRFSLPPDLMEKKMLRFLLQPLVENAIMHSGVTSSKDMALREIFIDFSISGKRLNIEVCNRGSTFREEDLKRILTQVRADGEGRKPLASEKQASHIGLLNIENRIRLLYGSEYGLYIGQREGFDTVVGIRLPME